MLIGIGQAISNLKAGKVVVLPTDTVYGLACDFENEEAIKNIYDLKGRSQNKPLIILISNLKMLEGLIKNFDQKYQILIDKFWPGALTLIFEKTELVSDLISANSNKIGIRMPANKQILEVINKFGKPIIATSVNKSGNESLKSIEQIINTFPELDILESLEEMGNKESSIIDLTSSPPLLIREGAISRQELNEVLNV